MAVPQRHDNLPGQMPSREQDIPSLFSDFDLYLFGQGKHYRIQEWNYAQSLDWHLLQPPHDAHHARLRDFVRDLNRLYRQEPALSGLDFDPAGFSWIDVHDSDNSVVSFMRKSNNEQETLVFVCNFTPVTRNGYRLGVPYAGEYYEVINSDATRYGGSGVENPQPMPSGPIPWQSCSHSILLTLPPLASVILKRRPISSWDRNPYIPS